MQVSASFDLFLRRVAGVIFALMGLAWIGSIVEGVRTRQGGLVAFAIIAAVLFFVLSWCYLRGPLSRVRAGRGK